MNRRGPFGQLTTAVALAALAASLIVDVPEASAAADGCDNFGPYPSACVQVEGAGTYVDWVRGGVALRARGSIRGHFEIWWDGGKVDTPDETLSNDSFVGHTKWGQKVVINHDLPRGSKVCSRFWERHGNGSDPKGTACVGIG